MTSISEAEAPSSSIPKEGNKGSPRRPKSTDVLSILKQLQIDGSRQKMSSAAAVPFPKEGNKDDTKCITLSILKELRVGSKGFFDFYGKVCNQITEVYGRKGVLDDPKQFILRCVIAIVGFIFLSDCQAEPMLPILLVVIGVGGLLIQITEEIADSLLKDNNTSTWKKVTDSCITALAFFFICWFIAGCVWLNRMPFPNMMRFLDNATSAVDSEKYCAFPVYGLAVWMVISFLAEISGCFVIVTVTAIVLYLLPGVENVKNMEIADDEEGLLKHGEKKTD